MRRSRWPAAAGEQGPWPRWCGPRGLARRRATPPAARLRESTGGLEPPDLEFKPWKKFTKDAGSGLSPPARRATSRKLIALRARGPSLRMADSVFATGCERASLRRTRMEFNNRRAVTAAAPISIRPLPTKRMYLCLRSRRGFGPFAPNGCGAILAYRALQDQAPLPAVPAA